MTAPPALTLPPLVIDIHDPAFGASIDGAPEGWRTTLDRLGREVARIRATRSGLAVHGAFTIERTVAVAPASVFRALSDPAAKAAGFAAAMVSWSWSARRTCAPAAGTRLVVSEQGAFLDGDDDAGARAHGTGSLLDRPGAALPG